MDDKDLEALKKLIETGNVTRAAQELFTTQPSLTKRLQKIEAELGCELFARSKKGIAPLPALERSLPKIESAVRLMEEIRDETRAASGEVAGKLKLGASVNFARYKLPALLHWYMKHYPGVQVLLQANQSMIVYRALVRGDIAVAVVRGSYPWKEGRVEVSREAVCVVRGAESASRPLEKLPFIARRSDQGLEDDFTRWRSERGLLGDSDQSRLVVNDIGTCLEMVRRGLGWSLLPSICLEGFDGVVEPAFFKDGTPLERVTHALWRDETAELPQVKAFLDCLMPER